MTEYKCKKCKAILYNGRLAREHLRKEHGIKKDLKNYYVKDDGMIVSKDNVFYRLGNKVIKIFRRG